MLPRGREQMLDQLNRAAKLHGSVAPRRPWCEPLPTQLGLADLDALCSPEAPQTRVGLMDDPANQAQPVLSFDPRRHGNLAIIGASATGKTNALRVIVERVRQQGYHCHWIAGAEKLTNSEACFDDSPAVLLIDDFDQFRQQHEFSIGNTFYQRVLESLNQGRSQQRYVVLSANRIAAIPSPVLPAIRQLITLGEPHPEQSRPPRSGYLASLLQTEQPRIPGRGWIKRGAYCELQFAHCGAEASES